MSLLGNKIKRAKNSVHFGALVFGLLGLPSLFAVAQLSLLPSQIRALLPPLSYANSATMFIVEAAFCLATARVFVYLLRSGVILLKLFVGASAEKTRLVKRILVNLGQVARTFRRYEAIIVVFVAMEFFIVRISVGALGFIWCSFFASCYLFVAYFAVRLVSFRASIRMDPVTWLLTPPRGVSETRVSMFRLVFIATAAAILVLLLGAMSASERFQDQAVFIRVEDQDEPVHGRIVHELGPWIIIANGFENRSRGSIVFNGFNGVSWILLNADKIRSIERP